MKPKWAFQIWTEDHYLFAELPEINGHPAHTLKLPNDAAGLREILNLAKFLSVEVQAQPLPEPKQPLYDPAMVRNVNKVQFTTEQRLSAREILRKLGMI